MDGPLPRAILSMHPAWLRIAPLKLPIYCILLRSADRYARARSELCSNDPVIKAPNGTFQHLTGMLRYNRQSATP